MDERALRSKSDDFDRRDYSREGRLVRSVVGMIVIFALLATGFASAGEQSRKPTGSFEVPRSDLAKAEALANQVSRLSPRVDPKEATLLAECAYATVSQLRREYRMFATPIFNNFLVYHGVRKRGYCYQWSEDLLIALDKLKLTTLELHWGEAHAGSWRENNCIVVTAKGQPFSRGIMLECWRHLGHLYSGPVVAAAVNNFDPYVENSTYARRVRERAAASNASATNRHVAFQRRAAGSNKAGE